MSRKGESIFKRKDGRYEGRYIKEYKDGKAIYGYVYASSYNECKKKRNIIISNSNEINSYSIAQYKNKDFNYLVKIWLNNKKIKQSSYTRYYNLINQHITNDIGKMRIEKLNSEIINNYIDKKLKNGRLDNTGGLSNNTVYDLCNILKQIINYNKMNITIKKIQKITGRGKTLYDDDRKKLEKYLINLNNNVSIGILLSLLLGIRESEICGLKFKDIDFKNKIIKIERIVSRVLNFDNNSRRKTKLIITSPKTINSKRILPIPNKIYEQIKNLKIDNDSYILTGNSRFMDPRTYYNKYKRILKELNLNYKYHDLRHTFVTNCIELGIDYKSLMELLGHSNIMTTMNIYVHPTINNKRKFVNKL